MRTDAQDGSAWSDLNRPPLRVGPLRRALTDGEHPAWRALDVVAQTQSSNADVMARARAGEAAGYVLVADQQTAGRGRLGRAWTTPPRAALAVSVLLRPTAPMQRWAWLGQLAGLAVVDALTRTCGVPARLKWPNDVLVPDGGDPDAPYRKVCGILAEAAPPVVVVGVGINVSQSEAELPVPTATSLLLAGGATLDRGPPGERPWGRLSRGLPDDRGVRPGPRDGLARPARPGRRGRRRGPPPRADARRRRSCPGRWRRCARSLTRSDATRCDVARGCSLPRAVRRG